MRFETLNLFNRELLQILIAGKFLSQCDACMSKRGHVIHAKAANFPDRLLHVPVSCENVASSFEGHRVSQKLLIEGGVWLYGERRPDRSVDSKWLYS